MEGIDLEKTEQTKPVSVTDVIDRLRSDYKIIDEKWRGNIIYAMRKSGYRNIRPKGVDIMCAALAIKRSGLPGSINLISAVLKYDPIECTGSLHILGDRHLLVLKKDKVPMEWTINTPVVEYFTQIGLLKGKVSTE